MDQEKLGEFIGLYMIEITKALESEGIKKVREAFEKEGYDFKGLKGYAFDVVKAKEYLNLVRDRAFGDADHRVTATGPALYDFILAERRVELVGEGHRFFDLVRSGKANQEIEGFTVNKNEVFPIPIEEIQFSGGNWQQNPNY